MILYALLPVSLYRAHYQLGYGRPYSALDRLVLKAISAGAADLDQIIAIFKLHRRLLVEVVVTLVRAGWIGIDAMSGHLALTKSGSAAVEKKILPRDSIVENRRLNCIVEKVAGQICAGGDVTFCDRRKLKDLEDLAVILPKSDISNTVTSGMIIPFLHRDQGSWVHSIGPITIARDNADFVLVKVDTSRREIYGIPDSWKPLLTLTILDRVDRREAELREHNVSVDSSKGDLLYRDAVSIVEAESWNVDPTLKDAILAQASNDVFVKVVRKAAKYKLLILSESTQVDPLFEHLREPLQGGTIIDMILPKAELPGIQAHIIELLKADSLETAADKVRVHGLTCRIPFNIALSDFENITGAVTLTAKMSKFSKGMFIEHGGLLSDLCRVVADFISIDPDVRLGSIPIRLRNYSGELSRIWSMHARSMAPGSVDARLLFSRQNIATIHQLLRHAERTIVLMDSICIAHNGGIFPMLIQVLRERAVSIKIIFNSLGELHDPGIMQEFEKLGGQVIHDSSVVSHVVVVDDHLLCTTSFGVLSESIGARNDEHIGLSLSTRQPINAAVPL